MTLECVSPKPLLPPGLYQSLSESAPGLDLQSLSDSDHKLGSSAANNADKGWMLGAAALIIGGGHLLRETPEAWREIWENASSVAEIGKFVIFPSTPFAALVLGIGMINRGINQITHDYITHPLAKAKFNSDLQQALKSEGIKLSE